MKKIILACWLSAGITLSIPASAGLFSSCDGASKEPRPEWVAKYDYSIAGSYVGVGAAEKDGKDKEEQNKAAENNARTVLVQRIEVTIRADDEQSTRVGKQGVQKDVQSKITVSAEEVLRDLQVKGRWQDPDSCTQYVLLAISKTSVAQAKRERLMKQRLEKFKNLLLVGTDRDKNPDINVRRKHLEDAQALLLETDFSLLPEEIRKEIYAKRLDEAMSHLSRAVAQVKGRMAVFALNQGVTLRSDVIAKMLDQLKASNSNTDRLIADCDNVDDCIKRASERGFNMLALLKADGKVTTSQMGALKGTLTISKTVYDIESHKIVTGPDTVSAQVIGWSNDELDWLAATDKAMQNFK